MNPGGWPKRPGELHAGVQVLDELHAGVQVLDELHAGLTVAGWQIAERGWTPVKCLYVVVTEGQTAAP